MQHFVTVECPDVGLTTTFVSPMKTLHLSDKQVNETYTCVVNYMHLDHLYLKHCRKRMQCWLITDFHILTFNEHLARTHNLEGTCIILCLMTEIWFLLSLLLHGIIKMCFWRSIM